MTDGADDRHDVAGRDRLVHRPLGRIRLSDAQRRPELRENLLDRRAFVGRTVGRLDAFANVRLDLPHRVADDIRRQKAFQRTLEHEQITVDA